MTTIEIKELREKLGKTQYRSLTFDRNGIDEEARTVPIAFSSEEPYERWYGNEILSHAKGAVNLSRLNNSAPLLVNHKTDNHAGVVETATIDSDGKGRAIVRFGNSAYAKEIFQDVIDGIRPHVSVGYMVDDIKLHKENKDGINDYLVTKWTPFETSFASIPADDTVGLNRSGEEPDASQTTPAREIEPITNLLKKEKKIMPKGDNPKGDDSPQVKAPDANEIRIIREETRSAELERITSITSLGNAHNQKDLAVEFTNGDKTVDEFRAALLEKMGKPVPSAAADTGLDEKQIGEFSFLKAINALSNPTSRAAQEDAAFEFECSRAASKIAGVESRGLRVPNEVLKRDQVVGTDTAGGHLVATELGGFIDQLQNSSIVLQRATVFRNLVGDFTLPRQTSGPSAYWVGESGAPTESQAALDQVALTPKTIAAWTDLSRKFLQQSSIDGEAWIRGELAKALGLGMDLAAINGSGASNQPTGILNTSGIGAVAGGTNGLAPTFAHLVDLETAIAQDNALAGDLGYVSNYKVAGKLKQTPKVASTDSVSLLQDGQVNGYEFAMTNQVPSDLDKGTSTGVCSAIIFANWADLFIGMWGGLDLMTDPYSNSTTGVIRVTAFQDMDVQVRHAESFAAMQDALTA